LGVDVVEPLFEIGKIPVVPRGEGGHAGGLAAATQATATQGREKNRCGVPSKQTTHAVSLP
jgi:hypothetical protein